MKLTEKSESVNYPVAILAKCENGIMGLRLAGTAFAGTDIMFAARNVPVLAALTDEQLAGVEIKLSGTVLNFPDPGIEAWVPGLLEMVLGITSQRSHLAKAGSVTSAAKAAAVAANGAKGGRPRKTVTSGGDSNGS